MIKSIAFLFCASAAVALGHVVPMTPVVALHDPGQVSSLDSIPFPNGKAFVRLPMQVLANAPYVDARVNGAGPFSFEVDTGAFTSPFARELAGSIGLDARFAGGGASAEFLLGESLRVTIPVAFASFENLWGSQGATFMATSDSECSSTSSLNSITSTKR